MKMIPYGHQTISESDINRVVEVLRSEWLTQGPMVPRFEGAISSRVGARYAVAVNSATSALHIACLALGVSKGDLVWTTPNTFVATANCVLSCGATVDFVDIDKRTYNISIEQLKIKLELAKDYSSLPKVVIVVHFAGQPCDMVAIYKLSQEYGFRVIEDASHALGAAYKTDKLLRAPEEMTPVGSCAHSDITVFSFHPVKIITTGEGGMALTNNSALAEKMVLLRTHGITARTESMCVRPTEELWNYQQVALGFNYRMTDIQAALGISQLEKLDDFLAKRREIASYYDSTLKNLPIDLPGIDEEFLSSYHLYPIRLRPSCLRNGQPEIYRDLRNRGIGVNVHYIPVYLHPYYESLGFKRGYCPESELFYRQALTIPIFPLLTDAQREFVVAGLTDVLSC